MPDDPAPASQPLRQFHPAVREWFAGSFAAPTLAQDLGWRPILAGESTLLLAPTGSGKTLAAFLVAIDRLMFAAAEVQTQTQTKAKTKSVEVLYISPLKALGVDVERNLRAPLAGIHAVAQRLGADCLRPSVGIRSGDTPQSERAKMARNPPNILITTPESLYLLLSSRARETLRGVKTVIIDEIHSLVASKRGTHLFLSLERLERERGADAPPLQRIGLSATQRPLDEIARLLGGLVPGAEPSASMEPRPVTIVDAGRKRAIELCVEVPVEDMARLGEATPDPEQAALAQAAMPGGAGLHGQGDDASPLDTPAPLVPEGPRSIWPSIYPRLVELIEAHRSTMIFVNNRSLAERLSGALNELAGKELALAHHGSISKEQRAIVEDRLKRGDLPAIVATSSLELGIDMGAVDLVVQIEAPPSVASGLQRIGRAGHQVGGVAKGVIVPKYRHDLLACAAVISDMREGRVEQTFYPRNPLDVLAQQIVAMAGISERLEVDALFTLVRQSAPFAELSRRAFESTLDMLAGRYPSNEFGELRPRIIWDRVEGTIAPRKGAQRLAVQNAGTIPDRGLYGVFMLGEGGGPGTRVGELDEEMVFESREGDVFILGASSWKITEISRDRVVVVPAPGEPGRMPFWHGEGPGRPLEFGRAIGALARKLDELSRDEAEAELQAEHALDPLAARNLVDYLVDQREATGVIPSDKTIVVERWLDEIGDWRVALLSPFGARVHAPWATAVAGRLREHGGLEVDLLWTDDGLAFRLPETDDPPPLELFFPTPDEVEQLVIENLSGSALFAARFRENAARALLLPRKRPGKRTPLWMQRKRSADLLQVASRYRSFPIILETYRECLRDVFDLPALRELLGQIADRRIRVREVQSKHASPYAAALVFTWIGNFLYDDDQPRAERRAQALALDYAQLRELLGDAELRELLDRDAITEVELMLQRLDPRRHIRDRDHVHDALRELGELSREELSQRCMADSRPDLDGWIDALIHERRIAPVVIAGVPRLIAAEDAGRYRDALGVVPPMGLPLAFVELVEQPLEDLVARYARTHGPFRAAEVAARLGLGLGPIRSALQVLGGRDRVLEGEFLPGGREREWCDVDVLRRIKRASLAKLTAAVEAVEPRSYARFLPRWHRIDHPGEGLDDLVGAIEQLQAIPLPFADLERALLPARIRGYHPSMLDQLCASGEVCWRGCEALGASDGRVALYLSGHAELLAPAPTPVEGPLAARLRRLLGERGAMFFSDIDKALGGFSTELLTTLWAMVWAGEITNDTLAPLRSRARAGRSTKSSRRGSGRRRPSLHGHMQLRRAGPPGAEGRWSLTRIAGDASDTQRATAASVQLLERFGVVTREAVRSAGLAGGFSAYYPVFKAMEAAGKLRRGYFIAGMGGAQFALPGAEDRLREEARPDEPIVILAACDPANAHGAALPWPRRESGAKPQRASGAHVFAHDGVLLAWLSRSEKRLLCFVDGDSCPDPVERERHAEALAEGLVALLEQPEGRRKVMLLEQIDEVFANEHWLAAALVGQGFRKTHDGLMRRRMRSWAEPDEDAAGARPILGVVARGRS